MGDATIDIYMVLKVMLVLALFAIIISFARKIK
jgi:hypothetical protein